MFVLNHEIAGITFKTDSDVEIAPLNSDAFKHFLTGYAEPDVYISVCGVGSDTLKLPPLTESENEQIAQCLIPPFLGRGVQTLPFTGLNAETDNPGIKTQANSVMDIPLLRAPIVRDRLHSCLDHPDQVGLVLHVSSVVIRDHFRRRIDLFYPAEHGEVFRNPLLEHGFRRLFASFLPAFSAVMVHSSALVRSGKTALFIAPDEGGKTTAVRNSTGGTILGDDQIILRKNKDAVLAYGTPWGSLFSSKQTAEVRGLFILEKAKCFELIPLRSVDAVESFWKEHLFYRVFLPKDLRVKAFETVCDACSRAPVYRMRFPKGNIDWEAIDAAMEDRLAA